MQLIATDWWCGFFLFPPFGQNITLNYAKRSYYLHFFHILSIQMIFIFTFIILCDIISYSIWFSLLNHLNSSGNGHGQLFLSFFYFSSFLLIFLAFPPLFPVLCTYIHLIELSLGWHPWQLSQAPCFVPQPVIPTPFRKTNSYIGLWAQTRLRLKSHSHIARQTRFQPPFPFFSPTHPFPDLISPDCNSPNSV